MLGTPLTTGEVLDAFLSCRKGKRNTHAAIEFELNLAHNICRITDELNSESWEPGSSMCFVVTNPKPREVWAAQFFDRVIHHVIYNRLRPRFEPKFIDTSFACIPGRGTGRAIEWAQKAARKITHGYTREAYALQMDIQSFFTSIHRPTLLDMLLPQCHESWLHAAVTKLFSYDIKISAHIVGTPDELSQVPPHKSLWNTHPDYGLPIGNLTSQFAANVYLNKLDQQVSPGHLYGRYVDDLVLFHTNPDYLWERSHDIREYVSNLHLAVHPNKTTVTALSRGVDFVGAFILPYRTYLRRATVKRGTRSLHLRPALNRLAAYKGGSKSQRL